MFSKKIIQHQLTKNNEEVFNQILNNQTYLTEFLEKIIDKFPEKVINQVFEKNPETLEKNIGETLLSTYLPEVALTLFNQSNQYTHISNNSQAKVYANKIVIREVLLGNVDNSVSHFYLKLPTDNILSQYMYQKLRNRPGEANIRLDNKITLVMRNLGTYGSLGNNYQINNLTTSLVKENQYYIYYYPNGEEKVKKDLSEQAKVAENWDSVEKEAEVAGLQKSQLAMLKKIQESAKQVAPGGTENVGEEITTTVEIK